MYSVLTVWLVCQGAGCIVQELETQQLATMYVYACILYIMPFPNDNKEFSQRNGNDTYLSNTTDMDMWMHIIVADPFHMQYNMLYTSVSDHYPVTVVVCYVCHSYIHRTVTVWPVW